MTISHVLDRGPSIPPSTLQNRLRDAREWRGLKQSDLAREFGVGRTTISNYEKGVSQPGKLVINAWAVICEVDVEWLKTGVVPTGDNPGTPSVGRTGLEPVTDGSWVAPVTELFPPLATVA